MQEMYETESGRDNGIASVKGDMIKQRDI
ncbi:MAG: DUF1508 domain-containing protein, partial [Ferruginibacter sp.]